jgi:DNA polymerase-3 subunit delta
VKYEDFQVLPPAKKLERPLVLLVGEERFFKEEAIGEIEAALGPGAERVERRAAARGGAAESAAALDEVRTPSLFAAKKLVLVRDAQHLVADQAAALAEIGARPFRGTVLVLDAAGLDRRTRAAKEVEKAALVIEAKPLFAEPPPWARGGRPWDSPLVDWIVRRARRRGRQLSPENAYRLSQLTGNDLFEIAATLEKLDLLLGERAVATEADVEAIAGRSRRDDAFAVADAVGRRDAAAALAILDRVFRTGLEDRKGGVIGDAGTIALIVFGRIYAKISEIRKTRAHLGRGGGRSRDAVAAALGIPTFLADRAVADAERFAGADLERAYRDLLEADLAAKGAGPAPRPALERLVVRLCVSRGGAPIASDPGRR